MTIFSWGGDIELYNTLQNIKFFTADTFYLQALIYFGALLLDPMILAPKP